MGLEWLKGCRLHCLFCLRHNVSLREGISFHTLIYLPSLFISFSEAPTCSTAKHNINISVLLLFTRLWLEAAAFARCLKEECNFVHLFSKANTCLCRPLVHRCFWMLIFPNCRQPGQPIVQVRSQRSQRLNGAFPILVNSVCAKMTIPWCFRWIKGCKTSHWNTCTFHGQMEVWPFWGPPER